MQNCVVIYNPNSGKLSNREDIKKIHKILENYGYETKIIYTEYRGHAKEITKKLKDCDLHLTRNLLKDHLSYHISHLYM